MLRVDIVVAVSHILKEGGDVVFTPTERRKTLSVVPSYCQYLA